MIIRREQPGDVVAARAVQAAAFRRPGGTEEPAEAGLLDGLRRCRGWLPRLSLVAEVDGSVVGHVVSTRGFVAGFPALGLGPIGVRPSAQHRGIGLALMHATIGAADAMDEPFIALLGAPGYYGRFGFVASSQVGIIAPDPSWGDHFQVLPLTGFTPDMRGTFAYAEPFNQLEPPVEDSAGE